MSSARGQRAMRANEDVDMVSGGDGAPADGTQDDVPAARARSRGRAKEQTEKNKKEYDAQVEELSVQMESLEGALSAHEQRAEKRRPTSVGNGRAAGAVLQSPGAAEQEGKPESVGEVLVQVERLGPPAARRVGHGPVNLAPAMQAAAEEQADQYVPFVPRAQGSPPAGQKSKTSSRDSSKRSSPSRVSSPRSGSARSERSVALSHVAAGLIQGGVPATAVAGFVKANVTFETLQRMPMELALERLCEWASCSSQTRRPTWRCSCPQGRRRRPWCCRQLRSWTRRRSHLWWQTWR
jgi:hypothetical protein